jgi:hypothetical protein
MKSRSSDHRLGASKGAIGRRLAPRATSIEVMRGRLAASFLTLSGEQWPIVQRLLSATLVQWVAS